MAQGTQDLSRVGDDAKRVLMVEDSEGHALLVRNALTRCRETRFELEHESRLDQALGALERQDYDAMLLDLSLPDGYGVSTLGSACSLANHLPVVVLTSTDDEELALVALRAGAQEYLVKDRLDYRRLPSTILRAIERHERTRRALEHGGKKDTLPGGPSWLRDPVTGLVSEAVLWDRLQHALDRAHRNHSPLTVARLAFESLADVREVMDPELADALLREAGARLDSVARRSDTLARFGPDGFVLLLEDATEEANTERLVGCLVESLSALTMRRPGAQLAQVVPSVGLSVYPADGATPAALLAGAEAARGRAVERGGGYCFYEASLH